MLTGIRYKKIQFKSLTNINIMEYYYIDENNQQVGPLTIEELKSENINKNSKVWKQGMQDWENAETIKELKILFTAPPPIPSNIPPPIQNKEITEEQEQLINLSSIPDDFDEQIVLLDSSKTMKELIMHLENIIKINYNIKENEEVLYKPYDLFTKDEVLITSSVYNNQIGRILCGAIEQKSFLQSQKGMLLCEKGIFLFFKDKTDYLKYSEIATYFRDNPKYQNFSIKVEKRALGVIVGNINLTAEPFTAFANIVNWTTKSTIYDNLLMPFAEKKSDVVLKAGQFLLQETALGSSKRANFTNFRESFIMVNFLKSLLKIKQS